MLDTVWEDPTKVYSPLNQVWYEWACGFLVSSWLLFSSVEGDRVCSGAKHKRVFCDGSCFRGTKAEGEGQEAKGQYGLILQGGASSGNWHDRQRVTPLPTNRVGTKSVGRGGEFPELCVHGEGPEVQV